MIADLIYDVGLHDGNDTAYYLARGFRVVAVEANPELAERAQQKFAAAIDDGRLELLEVAIAHQTGPVDFWVNDENPGYSSLFQEVAGRRGKHCHRVTVEGMRFRDILARYGVPYYLKIDIEMAERLCLADLRPDDRPAYVSVEANELEYLFLLHRVGYNAFKLIDQNRHNLRYRVYHNEQLLDRVRLAVQHKWWWDLRKVRRALSRWRARHRSSDRQVQFGHSGPFGEETVGEWQTLEEVTYNWLHFWLGYTRRGTLDPWGVFDLHATTRTMQHGDAK